MEKLGKVTVNNLLTSCIIIFVFFFRYGYKHEQNTDNSGYYFSKPKFQIYPYSQVDIPPLSNYQQQRQQQQQQQHYYTAPQQSTFHQSQLHSSQRSNYQNTGYLPKPQTQPLHTTVEISPSHSFELKQIPNGYEVQDPHSNYQQHTEVDAHLTQPQPHTESVPVIVLRIPGPHKYAAHLQALLQQYLELRAAEYISLLQQQEQRSQQHQPTQLPQQTYDYAPAVDHQQEQPEYIMMEHQPQYYQESEYQHYEKESPQGYYV